MTPTIRYVDCNHIHAFWDVVAPFMQASIDKGEGPADYNIHHIRQFIASGNWLLLVAVDETNTIIGASAVSFVNYPLSRVAFVTAIGGKFVICKDTFEQMKNILKQHGATKVQCYVRPAMQRFLERLHFEPGNRLLEIKI
mgnify:CR=1 FL=1